jgi:hypothetical protein
MDMLSHLLSSNLCKSLITKILEARGVEPLFPTPMSRKIQERLFPRRFEESKQ